MLQLLKVYLTAIRGWREGKIIRERLYRYADVKMRHEYFTVWIGEE